MLSTRSLRDGLQVRRLGDASPQPAPVNVLPWILPVLEVAQDRFDEERNLYCQSASITGAAGQVPTFVLAFPAGMDCELVAVDVYGVAGQLVGWISGAFSPSPTVLPVDPESSRASQRKPAARLAAGSSTLVLSSAAGRPVLTLNGANVAVPLRGLPTRWRDGISLQGLTLASTVRVWVAWREGGVS